MARLRGPSTLERHRGPLPNFAHDDDLLRASGLLQLLDFLTMTRVEVPTSNRSRRTAAQRQVHRVPVTRLLGSENPPTWRLVPDKLTGQRYWATVAHRGLRARKLHCPLGRMADVRDRQGRGWSVRFEKVHESAACRGRGLAEPRDILTLEERHTPAAVRAAGLAATRS
jgi:hypothetical protein